MMKRGAEAKAVSTRRNRITAAVRVEITNVCFILTPERTIVQLCVKACDPMTFHGGFSGSSGK